MQASDENKLKNLSLLVLSFPVVISSACFSESRGDRRLVSAMEIAESRMSFRGM